MSDHCVLINPQVALPDDWRTIPRCHRLVEIPSDTYEDDAGDDDWRATAEACVRAGVGTPWEQGFCRTLVSGWNGALTEHQSAVLARIAKKLRRAA